MEDIKWFVGKKRIEELLKLIKYLLPEANTLPETTYEARYDHATSQCLWSEEHLAPGGGTDRCQTSSLDTPAFGPVQKHQLLLQPVLILSVRFVSLHAPVELEARSMLNAGRVCPTRGPPRSIGLPWWRRGERE